MVQSKAATVEEYLKELPEDRREIISEMRDLVLENLHDGYRETMNWGMISYEIPLEEYPDTYNDQPLSYLALAAKKNYNALYMMCIYSDPTKEEFLKNAAKNQNKKLDMGKSCIRFKKPDDLPLDAISELVGSLNPAEYIEVYEESRKK